MFSRKIIINRIKFTEAMYHAGVKGIATRDNPNMIGVINDNRSTKLANSNTIFETSIEVSE